MFLKHVKSIAIVSSIAVSAVFFAPVTTTVITATSFLTANIIEGYIAYKVVYSNLPTIYTSAKTAIDIAPMMIKMATG